MTELAKSVEPRLATSSILKGQKVTLSVTVGHIFFAETIQLCPGSMKAATDNIWMKGLDCVSSQLPWTH